MSVNIEDATDAPEVCNAKRTDRTIAGISSDSNEERIRANLEPPIAQISSLIHLLNQLLQNNSAKNTPTAGPRTHRPQAESGSLEKPELLEPCQE